MNCKKGHRFDMDTKLLNRKRKDILYKLDSGESCDTLDLGMYDLTPYFKDDKFDITLTEMILLNKNISRRINHVSDEMYFFPKQYEALQFLSCHERVILSAPTSFGKTLLAKEYIFMHKPKVVVYIVPTNALAYELERAFKQNENFSDYTIFDKCRNDKWLSTDDDSKKIFIGTQEKYLALEDSFVEGVDLFIIDEAYKLEEKVSDTRAYKLSVAFLSSVNYNAKKIFLLTPPARFIGFDKYDFKEYLSDFNIVEKKYSVVEEDKFYSVLCEKIQTEKTILFCKYFKDIDDVARELPDYVQQKAYHPLASLLAEEIHPEWNVVKLLKMGILTHHGQMPKYVQNIMIKLFNQDKAYNLLVGTNSLSEGINTVTKNLFIHKNYKQIYPNHVFLLKNTIGRAGRLGKYPVGHIYSVFEIEKSIEQEVEIKLAISDDEELKEIENSQNDEKVQLFCNDNNIDFAICRNILNEYSISLSQLGKIISELMVSYDDSNVENVINIAFRVFDKSYKNYIKEKDLIISGIFFSDSSGSVSKMISEFSRKTNNSEKLTNVINWFMGFIYSRLEYQIMPIVKIGKFIHDNQPDWPFGNNVIESLELCEVKYNKRIYGSLNVDELSDSHKLIIDSLKDYGLFSVIRKLNLSLLNEMERHLNIRYSTYDVINAIKKLAKDSPSNKEFFSHVQKKYML